MIPNRRTFLKQLGYGAAGLGLVTYLPGCGTTRAVAGSGRLPRSTPEAEGVSSAAVLAFLDGAARAKHEFHSFMQGQLDLVWEHLLPAMNGSPLPADRAAQARLQQMLAALALTPPNGEPAPPLADRVSGKTFQIKANDLGLQSASFVFRKGACLFTVRDAQGEYPIECGLEKWERGETALPGTPPRLVSGGAPKSGTKSKVAASGAWKDAATFEMTWRYYETPHHDTVTCRFEGNKVQIAFMNSIAQMSPTPKDKRPTLQGEMAV